MSQENQGVIGITGTPGKRAAPFSPSNKGTPSKTRVSPAKAAYKHSLFTSPRKSMREPEPLLDENSDRFCM